MSELTPCNYCKMRTIKATARREHKLVITHPHPMGSWKTGVDVYSVPDHGERWVNKPHKKFWVAWFAELTDHCVC